jgi:DNA-binding transcriptional MerR regulator
MTDNPTADQLQTLREYRQLAPWNLRDLTALAGALLETSGIRPTSTVANVRPKERTVRYYVTRGLVTPPSGRGAAATYSYKHLLQVLAIKLRQMEGQTLATIARDLPQRTGDVVERQVAGALGPNLPSPSALALSDPLNTRGRAGRAMRTWHALGETIEDDLTENSRRFAVTKWHRIPIVRGLELHVHEGHPLAVHTHHSKEIGDAVRRVVSRLLSELG